MLTRDVQYMHSRTAMESKQRLDDLFPDKGYRPDEYARPDDFFDAYVGKTYDSNIPGLQTVPSPWGGDNIWGSELTSMGLQRVYEDPAAFTRVDSGFFDFLIEKVFRP